MKRKDLEIGMEVEAKFVTSLAHSRRADRKAQLFRAVIIGFDSASIAVDAQIPNRAGEMVSESYILQAQQIIRLWAEVEAEREAAAAERAEREAADRATLDAHLAEFHERFDGPLAEVKVALDRCGLRVENYNIQQYDWETGTTDIKCTLRVGGPAGRLALFALAATRQDVDMVELVPNGSSWGPKVAVAATHPELALLATRDDTLETVTVVESGFATLTVAALAMA